MDYWEVVFMILAICATTYEVIQLVIIHALISAHGAVQTSLKDFYGQLAVCVIIQIIFLVLMVT